MRVFLLLFIALFISTTQTLASPNCPPDHQHVCKELIQVLEIFKSENYYKWDGTHLYITLDFGKYNNISNQLSGGSGAIIGSSNPEYYTSQRDFFPILLNDLIAKTQNGQSAYLHIYSIRLQRQAHIAFTEPSSGTGNQQSVTTTSRPVAISVQSAAKNHPAKHIDKHNINQHFVTAKAGSQIQHNERSYMIDSNNKIWTCKISGMGARRITDQHGKATEHGHVETLHFHSRHIAHIPANNQTGNNCLISVHK